MATLYGENATLRDNSQPSQKIRSQEQHGRMRIAHDQISLSAALALNDEVIMMKLPAGAKIYEAELSTDDLGTTGVLDIGWEASSGGGEAADQDGLFAAVDVATAAVARQKMANSVAGFQKRFSEEVRVKVVATTATTATSGDIKLSVWYVVD
jgi:hypothetical protein